MAALEWLTSYLCGSFGVQMRQGTPRPSHLSSSACGYSINKHIDVSIDASNLTKAVNNTYFGETIRPRFNNIYDRRVGIVLRIKS